MSILEIVSIVFFIAAASLLIEVHDSRQKDRKLVPGVDTAFWHRMEIAVASTLIVLGVCLLMRSLLWDLIQWFVNDRQDHPGAK
jgi:hypothetical protein